MSKRSRISLIQTLLCLFLAASATTPCRGQVKVNYTGRTLGYLRIPDAQSPTRTECPDRTEATGAAKGFLTLLDQVNSTSGQAQILVGMGDNFGPELFARTFDGYPSSPGYPKPGTTPLLAMPEHHVPHPGKDLFVWDDLPSDAPPHWVPDDAVPPALSAKLSAHQGSIPMDNVGCFFRIAGYDAIVPGKHDFGSGPEFLINMSKFLLSSRGDLHKTRMLGANLSISTAVPEVFPAVPLYQLQHDFEAVEKARQAAHQPSYRIVFPTRADEKLPGVSLPGTVYPWMTEITISNAFQLCTTLPAGNPAVCPPASLAQVKDLQGTWTLSATNQIHTAINRATHAAANAAQIYLRKDANTHTTVYVEHRTRRVQLCQNAARQPYGFLIPQTPNCSDLVEKPGVPADAFKSGSITYLLNSPLLPDHNYGICVEIFDHGEFRFYCQPFYVTTPFFSFEDGGSDADPYQISAVADGKIAIFGLVDPDMQNQIGRLNYAWWNSNTSYETTVRVNDPLEALKQAMMRCQQNDACINARKVLLAQMPAFKARTLLNSINAALKDSPSLANAPNTAPPKIPKFDLVISQTDPNNKTGTVVVNKGDATSLEGSFVVTPDEMYGTGKLTYNINRAAISAVPASPISAAAAYKWSLDNRVTPGTPLPIPPPPAATQPGQISLRQAAETALPVLPHAATIPNPKLSAADVLSRLALVVTQQKLHTDISMMQTRDFFEPQSYGPAAVTPDNLQELLDRVFWKNDFAVPVPVTGATLTSMLAASDVFDANDQNPLDVDLETGRSLVKLGVFKEAAEKNLAVNGNLVDPAKLYSAALTSFLAVGDTGYTALQTPAVPPPYRSKNFKKLYSISGLVCRAIANRVASLNGAPCNIDTVLDAAQYQDQISQLPPDQTPGNTVQRQAAAYLNPFLRWKRFHEFYTGQNDIEKISSQKKYWTLSVEKTDFGWNVLTHKTPTATLASEFGGGPVAAATAPNAYTISFDNRMRLKRSTQALDYYALDDISFASSRTQDSTDNNFTRNLTANSLSGEGGILLHLSTHLGDKAWTDLLKRHERKPRQLDLLIAGRLDTQVFPPREDLSISAQTCLDMTNTACANSTPPPPPCSVSVTTGCLSGKGTLRGTVGRSEDLYAKLGLRYSDPKSWFEFGVFQGKTFNLPYQLQLANGSTYNTVYLEQPGTNSAFSCNGNQAGCAPPPAGDQSKSDWLQFLSNYGLITPATKVTALYSNHPITGLFVNFSFNTPIWPGNRWARADGGQPIMFRAENMGRFYFNRSGELPVQTRHLFQPALSLVIPVIGNLSLKPEVDLVYYENAVANTAVRSVNYLLNFSYTFDWRQGQPWWRAVRFASPAPTGTVTPTSGR